jgi:hypothetical protein
MSPFDQARAHFVQAVARHFQKPEAEFTVTPSAPAPEGSELASLGVGGLYAFGAQFGASPGPKGFASAGGEVVLGKDRASFRHLAEACGLQAQTPGCDPAGVALRLAWVLPAFGPPFLKTGDFAELTAGRPQVTPPSASRQGEAVEVSWFTVQSQGGTGARALLKHTLRVEPDHSATLSTAPAP